MMKRYLRDVRSRSRRNKNENNQENDPSTLSFSPTKGTSIVHIPAKRRLELTLNPSKRQKFGFAVDSISDFKDLKSQGLFYADKTMHIKHIETHSRSVLMFLRPNRFGKSLLLSTLKYFYDINEVQYFRLLFESLAIYQFASGLKHNKYLILEWDFSRIPSFSDVKEMNKRLENHINTSIVDFCHKYAYILEKNFEDLKQSVVCWDDCITSFENLLRTFRECEYKIYVLIDNYDAITNENFVSDGKDWHSQLLDKLSLYKAIFATLKAHRGKEVERVFIIGMSPLLINNISSSFGISYDITLEQDFKYMCGLEEKDIKKALTSIFTEKEHHIDEEKQNFIKSHFKKIRITYNEYKYQHMQGSGIYCTNICLNYLQQVLDGKPIGVNNELNDSMLRFVGKYPYSRLLFAELLGNQKTSFTAIQQQFRLTDLNDVDQQNTEFLESFLFYFGWLTFADKPHCLCLPNVVIMKSIIHRIAYLCRIDANSQEFKHAVNNLIYHHDINTLCLYLQSKLKEWIKRGNLYDDRELVTKVMFHVSLSTIPNYLNDTEVPIDIYSNRVLIKTCYADLLIAETRPTSDGVKQNRFIFEFKCKGINFLDLKINGYNRNWDVMENRANKVETMSESDVRQLKCGNGEQFDKGKTMEQILNDGREQLLLYVHNLNEQDSRNHCEFVTSAFVVLTVGSRKLLWNKVYPPI